MKKPRIVASIEARMGSSRLPGKVLKEIHGKPVLRRIVDRMRTCRLVDDVVVATSVEQTDDVLVDWCIQNEIPYFRGNEDDVLKRVVDAHKHMNSEIIVEITGDCPLIDPKVADKVIEIYLENDVDVAHNCREPLSWPNGLDTQVFSLSLLEDVERNVSDPAVREHVSLYFYEHPERYDIKVLTAPPKLAHPDWRLVLDYPEDFQFVCALYEHLEPIHGQNFGMEEIVDFLEVQPELLEINSHCIEKSPR